MSVFLNGYYLSEYSYKSIRQGQRVRVTEIKDNEVRLHTGEWILMDVFTKLFKYTGSNMDLG